MKKTLSSLAAVALLATPVLALADTADSALVKGGALNLREEASAEAKVLAQYKTGTLVEVISNVNDNWAKVKVDGKAGYMMRKYLNDANGSTTLLVNTSNGLGLNMREQPRDSGAILTSYKRGTKITVLQRGNNWSRVQMDGKEGFMASRFLVKSLPSESATPSTGAGKATVSNPKGTQWLNLRETASLDAKVLGSYKNGVVVEVLDKGATWSKVKVDGKTGYMMNKYLSFGAAASYVQPAFKDVTPYDVKLINVNGTGIVNFRDGGSLNAKVIRTYKVGTVAKVLAESTDWLKVEIEGEAGYISRWFTKK